MKKRHYPKWLDSAIFYQIYPQSFCDSNGDGIGDLPGVISKLDYVASLGCNAIWLNPCFVSPFRDAGYDVADYYKVAPRYGTNADLKRLFKAAHARGIRVCLDLVPGHTSVDHPWFQASARPEKNAFTNRYVWADDPWGFGDGAGSDGFRTIHGYGDRTGAYVTNFFWAQPALNFGFGKPNPKAPWQLPVDHPDCRATRDEMKKIMRYWLAMGADGFRVDMALSLVKKDPQRRETKKLWQDIRGALEREYPECVLISEAFEPTVAVKCGFHMDFTECGGLSLPDGMLRAEEKRSLSIIKPNSDSYFDKRGAGDAMAYMKNFLGQREGVGAKGRIGLFTGNHDLKRISIGRTAREIELVFAFILTMPATPFIYYGDEIGMANQGQLLSKEGGYERTGARTPMQWTAGKNAGFSSGKRDQLYLPVEAKYAKVNVTVQEKNPRSLLNRVRLLTALRQTNAALQGDGGFELAYCRKHAYPLVYVRSAQGQRMLVVLNPSGEDAEATFRVGKGVKQAEKLMGTGKVELTLKGSVATVRMGRVAYGVFGLGTE